MTVLMRAQSGPGSGAGWRALLGAALLAIALLSAAIATCCAPSTAFADAGGSVPLGINVKAGTATGSGGSVELGVKVEAGELPSGGDGEVLLGINVKAAEVHQVSFVGYYCDEHGGVIEDDGVQRKETIEVQAVRHGGHASEPGNLERTDADGTRYWVDGWYAYGQDGTGAQTMERVNLDTYEVTGGTTFFCYWKKGYVVRLDANNGSTADGTPVFDGEVDGANSSFVAVERDVDFEGAHDSGDPEGYDAPAFPAATRPGYVFAGWYWADESGLKDHYGRVELREATGDPVASAEDEKGYDFFREHCAGGATPTLYAKWVLAPLVRIELEGATGTGADTGVNLWFWPGRGYALSQPALDKEIEAGFILRHDDVPESGLDVTETLAIAGNPHPSYPAQAFRGWGYSVQGETGQADPVELVSCKKGEDGAFSYLLGSRVFDYMTDDMEYSGPADADDMAGAPAGQKKATWQALFDAARISVTAPFEVTFQKKGASYASDETDVVAFALDELEGKLGWNWIESIEQRFYNKSSIGSGEESAPVTVYVSAIECIDVGASAIFPLRDDASDKKVFSLYEEGMLGGGAGGAIGGEGPSGPSLRFGYATDGGANKATANASNPVEWMRLPPAEGDACSKELYFGLDLSKVRLNRSAIAMGAPPSSSASAVVSQYVAGLANIKYTYSVVP